MSSWTRQHSMSVEDRKLKFTTCIQMLRFVNLVWWEKFSSWLFTAKNR